MRPRLQSSKSDGPRKRNVLAYAGRPISTSEGPSFPLGITSLSGGIFAAAASLALTSIHGIRYLQEPILVAGTGSALLAILLGIIAACLPGERVRGVLGLSLGILSGLLLPMFAT